MSKTVFLLRHAQSAGKQTGQRDYDRILTAEGEAEAKRCGKIFSESNNFPDLILCSAAMRTKQTIQLFNESLKFPAEKIQYKEDMYDALMTHLLEVIQALPSDINKVLLVGHNPGISLLAADLSSSFVDLSTSQLVGYEFKTDDWYDVPVSAKQIFNSK